MARWQAWCLPLVIAVVVIGSLRLLEVIYQRPNWATMAVASLGDTTEILAMGSSRIFFGLDPRVMQRPTSNLSVNYLDAQSMRQLWRQYAARLPNAKTVIAELCVVNLKFETLKINPAGLKDLGIAITPGPADFVTSFDSAVRRLLLPIFLWRLTPHFYRESRYSGAENLEPTAVVPGFVPSRVRMAYPEAFAKRRVAYFQHEMQAFRADIVDANIVAYRDLIATLNAAGKRVVLVRFPIYQPVYQYYPADWNAQIDRALAELRQDPALTFEFWDEHAYQGINAEEFRDPEHLNAAGAAKFTKYLADRLN